MSLFKCKMCGGSLEIPPKATVIECEYCGTPQTLPKLHDEKLNSMLERADQFRRAKDFDKALEIYEEILTEKNDDSEIYWLIVLCRYGIEYVDDPSSHQKIPTVNRAQFTSIYDDTDYQLAIRYADTIQKMLYEKEAATINEIQKGILAISCQEEPYDVFICYKETDENGERTHDSVDATDLYYELTEMGYKVFFSRITLEDKLGTAYEPYIFAALNSAKIMVVLGSKPEYFNAVWVKNEWSRFLSLMKTDRKRTLIPAYRNMDPYNLPKEFSHLQALDMNKLGFMSDLTRGIKKIIGDETIRDSKFKHLMNSAIPADGCKDITSSSNQSGTVTFYGFKKWLPVMSAVSIRINGIDIGTVSRGETLSWSFIGNANVDLRYCGDFNWRRNALSLTPGVTNVQLEYGVRTLVSKKW